ncbi:MAG TPA: spore coat protein [Bacillota bacterium]|nr:spore coat protein [Bacillota bacterium]
MQFLENMTGMNILSDQTISGDLLMASKTGVRNLAYAITETASPQLRQILKKHLADAIDSHEKVTNYMMNQNWYPAYNVDQLIQMDLQTAQNVLNLQ